VTDPVRQVWTRLELVAMARADPQERMALRVAISPKLLLLLMDYQQQRRDESCEIVMAHGDPGAVELRFFYREDEDS